MDTNSREAAPPDPLITVEPAPSGHRGVDWTPVQDTGPYPILAPGPCPHRVRVRDLKASSKIVFTLTVPLMYGSALLGFAGLIFGLVMTGAGFAKAEPALFMIGPILVVVTVVLGCGFVVCLRVWRSLHKPGRLVCVLNTIAPAMFLVLAAFLIGGGGPMWLLLFALPPMVTTTILWFFHAVLYPSGTCGAYPWLPAKIQRLLET
jgi:hypothetical protein